MAKGHDRDLTLDFVKGILVVVMVIYHAMNIFAIAGDHAFGYIRFVSGSFILLSGYIVASFFETRFREDSEATSRRLLLRGGKLLAIFTALNMVIHISGVGNPNKPRLGMQGYLGSLDSIYLWGEPGLVSFQILLPIAYLLMISPLILLLRHLANGLLIISLVAAFGFSLLGWESTNLEFLILGLVGTFAGLVSNNPGRVVPVGRLPALVVAIALCIGAMPLLSTNLLTYTVAIMLLLKLIYDTGSRLNGKGVFTQSMIVLGQYSLVAYIAQIIFLQFLAKALGSEKSPLGLETIFVSIVTVVFLMGLCFLLTRLRERFSAIEKSYRFIFS